MKDVNHIVKRVFNCISSLQVLLFCFRHLQGVLPKRQIWYIWEQGARITTMARQMVMADQLLTITTSTADHGSCLRFPDSPRTAQTSQWRGAQSSHEITSPLVCANVNETFLIAFTLQKIRWRFCYFSLSSYDLRTDSHIIISNPFIAESSEKQNYFDVSISGSSFRWKQYIFRYR